MTDDGFLSSPDGQQPRHALHDLRRRAEHAAPRDTPVGRHERHVGKHAATASDLGVKPLGEDGGEARHVHRHEVQELAVQSEQDPVTDFMSMSGGQPIALWDGGKPISTSTPRLTHSTFAQDVSSSVDFAHHAVDSRQGSDDGADDPFVIEEDAQEPPLDLADIRTYLRHRAAERPDAGQDNDDVQPDDDGAQSDTGEAQRAQVRDDEAPADEAAAPASAIATAEGVVSQSVPQSDVSQSGHPLPSFPRSGAGRHCETRSHAASPIDDTAQDGAVATPRHGARGLDGATQHAGHPAASSGMPTSARQAPSRPVPDVHAPDPVTTGHVAAKVPGTDIVLYTSNPAAVAVALELAGGLERPDAPASYPVKPDARPQHPRSAFSRAYPFLMRHHALESDAERRHRTRRREVYDESLHIIDDLTNRPVDPMFEDAALYRRKESPRTTWGMRILSFVICVLIGFVFMGAVQLLQSNTREKVRKEEADQLTQLVARSEDLQNEVSVLRRQVDELSKSSSTTVKIPDSQNILNGTVEVTGPGIVITLRNPSLLEESSGGASGTDSTLSGMRDVADTDIQLFVDRLWATGAEAISVNGQRLGPETSIRAAGGKILIGVVAIQSPYTIEAIGNADAMRVGVDSDHNPQLYDSFDKLGIAVSLSQKDKLDLSANAVATLEYATEGTGNGDGSD
ncbi:MAG: DUF881 domain-containing protein [Pseudoscardovia radai]|nr:DUF881 domain-containing protein [Pseudoscardovia radai]